MFYSGNLIHQITVELGRWDTFSILALLLILGSLSSKKTFYALGSSYFVFKLLGIYWGLGYSSFFVLKYIFNFSVFEFLYKPAIDSLLNKFFECLEALKKLQENLNRICIKNTKITEEKKDS